MNKFGPRICFDYVSGLTISFRFQFEGKTKIQFFEYIHLNSDFLALPINLCLPENIWKFNFKDWKSSGILELCIRSFIGKNRTLYQKFYWQQQNFV